MRTKVVKLAAPLLALLACGVLALGQRLGDENENPKQPDKKPKPDKPEAKSLADLLAEALKNNPDLRVAEAKLREADAELNRTRLQVMQKVVAFHHALESQKIRVKLAEADADRAKILAANRAVSAEDVNAVQKKLILAKAKLAEMEAELPYLLGRQSEFRIKLLNPKLYADALDGAQKAYEQWLTKGQPVRGEVGRKLRNALDLPVTVKIEKATPLQEVLEFLEDKVPGITFRIVEGKKKDIKTQPIQLNLKQRVPLGAAIQAIGDSVPGLRFAVREYGVLVTWEDQLPPGAVLVHDFWKGEADKARPEAANKGGAGPQVPGNPPPVNVGGHIKAIDPKTGLAVIDIGSDVGLKTGHTLEVFRLQPRPEYVGVVLIMEVRAKSAVGKLTSRGAAWKVGDLVASRVVPR
jgi:hypothetical protein